MVTRATQLGVHDSVELRERRINHARRDKGVHVSVVIYPEPRLEPEHA